MAEAKFAKGDARDANYEASFGNLPNGVTYSDPMGFKSMSKPTDLRPEILKAVYNARKTQLKALGVTAGGAGTAGYAMIPIHVDPDVIDTTRKYTPFIELCPRVTNVGTYADYNVITAKGGAAFLPQDSALTDQNDTYDRKSTAIKYAYSVGRVTGPAQAAMPAWNLPGFQPSNQFGPWTGAGAGSGKQLEVLVKTRALREAEEQEALVGSTSTNPDGYDGLMTLQSTTNEVDKSSTALDLDDIHTAIEYAFVDGGRPNLAVCSANAYTQLQQLLKNYLRIGTGMTKLPWGYETLNLVTQVGQIPVIPSPYMTNTANNKSILFLDMSVVEMRVLQDITYEELAKTNDSQKFMLKVYEAIINKNTAFGALIDSIA